MQKKKQKIKIIGGNSLQGTISIEPNKNAVLPVLCAALLTSETCELKNVPRSPDVIKILEAIKDLGGDCSWSSDQGTLTICCEKVQSRPVSDCVADIQSAILFAGPLLARFGEADIPVAIGCKLGYRGPEDHIYYLSKLGVVCSVEHGRIRFSVDKKALKDDSLLRYSLDTVTKSFIFTEASVTPTENLLMLLSTVTRFDTRIEGVAQEPHVEFLVQVLRHMGVAIEGGGNTLLVKGVHGKLGGFEVDFQTQPDHVDFYGTAVMVALTKGEVLLKCVPTRAIQHMVEFLSQVGIVCMIESDGVRIHGSESSFSPIEGFARADDRHWKMNPKPWPGFPVDCLPSFIAYAAANTHNDTGITTTNWMYEDGLGYAKQLITLGAAIEIYETKFGAQKLLIGNVSEPYTPMNQELITISGVPVIEGARALISAAITRKGITEIEDIAPFLRRNPSFVEKYRQVGASIEIVD